MSLSRASSLSRTSSALRSSSAMVAIRSLAALASASSRSIATSRSAAEHPTPPRHALCALLSAWGIGVGLLPYPAAPRPPRRLLGPLWRRAVLDVGRRAPVRPLRADAALLPSPRAAYSPPIRAGCVRRRALRGALPTRR